MTKNNPLVSVIVPVYNTVDYLTDCLETITKQTYQRIEIIVVNDGSTDDSAKKIAEYAKRDNRIKVVTQKNQGLSGARNAGLKKMTGKYVMFVDSDDEIELDMVEKLLSAVEHTGADIAVCSFKELYPNGKIAHFNRREYPEATFNTSQALKTMLKERGFMVSATMKLFPAKFFKDVKFPPGKLHEDLGTTYKLLMKAKKIIFIPEELYIYVHHVSSIIAQEFDDRKFDIIELTDKMCDDIEKEYPELKNVVNERRMRARFSVLRQIPLKHKRLSTIMDYLRVHREFITKNPEASKTDKVALRLAFVHPKLFQIAYKVKNSS